MQRAMKAALHTLYAHRNKGVENGVFPHETPLLVLARQERVAQSLRERGALGRVTLQQARHEMSRKPKDRKDVIRRN